MAEIDVTVVVWASVLRFWQSKTQIAATCIEFVAIRIRSETCCQPKILLTKHRGRERERERDPCALKRELRIQFARAIRIQYSLTV